MKARPTVSIVMPLYNAAETLDAAFQSIQSQTFEDWELIVLDDGSTDGSRAVAASVAEKDRRVRLILSPHLGIVEALKRACSEVRGKLIARMDADDLAYPERIAKQVALMSGNPDVALSGTGVKMFGPRIGPGRLRYEQWLNSLTTHEAIVRELFVECPVAHPTFMMRRDAFEAAGGYQDHGWAEDHDLCMRVWLAGFRFGKTPETLLEWRESPSRLSMTDERYSPERFRMLKRCYLLRAGWTGHRPFHQWGAGEVGKRWLREWGDTRPIAVVDINPRKIGRRIHGIPVIPAEELPRPGETFTIVAVGAPGARDEIRAWMAPRGYLEGIDFLFVA